MAAELTKMGVITQSVMVQAAIDVRRMSPAQKVHLADEIFLQQPNLLASILVLQRMGVGMVELEVPVHILLVTFQAMKLSGRVWPVVTEDIQEGCMQRLTARARFNEGLPADLANKVVKQFCDEHAERYLLAFVYGYLGACWPYAPTPRSSSCWARSTSWSASPSSGPLLRLDNRGRGHGRGSRWGG